MLEALGLDTVAEDVYRRFLTRSCFDLDEIPVELNITPEQASSAVKLLSELKLVRPSVQDPGSLRVTSPEVGLSLLLERKQADLAQQQLRIAESRETIAQLAAEYSTAASSVEVEEVIGMDAVIDRIQRLALRAETQVDSFMPGGAQDPKMIEQAKVLDQQILHRGVRIRTVGLNSIRNDPPTLRYANWLAENGGEVRTLPTLSLRMLIYDRKVALLPVDPENTRMGVVQLTGKGTLTALNAYFDQVWESAYAMKAQVAATDEPGISHQEIHLLRLLSEGVTDEKVAQKFGVSARTVRRMIADIMSRLDARSRFQAGIRIAERGWLKESHLIQEELAQ